MREGERRGGRNKSYEGKVEKHERASVKVSEIVDRTQQWRLRKGGVVQEVEGGREGEQEREEKGDARGRRERLPLVHESSEEGHLLEVTHG